MRSVLLALLLACLLPAHAAERVLVFAAASTTDALQEVGRAFTKEQGTAVEFAFGASSDLARQAVAGAPADVFLSADTAKMDQVEKAGLIQAGSRVDLLSNRLVVVVPADSKRKVASAAELRGGEAAGARGSGGGARGRLREGVAGEGGRVEGAGAARGAHAGCARGARGGGGGPGGRGGGVRHGCGAVEARARGAHGSGGGGPRIVYPAAALAKGKASEAGRAFVRFLQGDAARRIFERYGFIVLSGKQKP